MDEWMLYLHGVKLELGAKYRAVVISDRLMASMILRGSGLSAEKRAQVLFNCGGTLDPGRMETVTFPHLHEADQRLCQVLPKKHVTGVGAPLRMRSMGSMRPTSCPLQ